MTQHNVRDFSFDAASAISCGAREYQEDALLADFANGDDLGFVILSDGMGGHAAGDVASKIVLTEVFRKLTFQRTRLSEDPGQICDTLRDAADTANASLKHHVGCYPETEGMGATLLSAVVKNGDLFWISIGDSPLFLFRDGVLRQLNEDHSMARQIDLMHEKGMLDAEEAQSHPDRNVLTSVLFGAPIAQIDCPSSPVSLQAGDTVIVASDGLQFLSDEEISKVLRDFPLSKSKEIADELMNRLAGLNDPDLDNISLSVLQIAQARPSATVTPLRPQRDLAEEPSTAPSFGTRGRLAAKGLSLFARKSQG
ncbi:MAG: protein phosphatase 2C domain-containing protein [Pseudomonadota bacterium]